jgi:hypothetical protein
MKSLYLSAMFVMAALGLFTPRIGAQDKNDGPDHTLFELANRERAAQGLAPLRWNAALAKAAQQHASLMAQQNTLSHQLPGEAPMQVRASRAGARFSSLAENVAEGPDAGNIHRQWMESSPHRANLLDPQLDSIGVAVAEHNGILFAVQDFSLAVGGSSASPNIGMSISEQEKTVNAQLQHRGLHLLNEVNDARQSCVLDNGYAGTHEPSFVLHYATSDLQTLPDMLEKRIETGRYHSAVVGACPTNGKTGSAAYRIAVLLFEDE